MWVCGVGRGEGSDGGKKGNKDRPWEATDESGRMDAVRYTKRMGGKGRPSHPTHCFHAVGSRQPIGTKLEYNPWNVFLQKDCHILSKNFFL